MRVRLSQSLHAALHHQASVDGISVEELIDRLLIDELPSTLLETARSYLMESKEGDQAARNGRRVIAESDDRCSSFDVGAE